MSKAIPMVIDPPSSPRCKNAEASSSQRMSSLRKCFCYKGPEMPYSNPDYKQEGVAGDSHPLIFNDGSDVDLITNDNKPCITQVIKGQTPMAASLAATTTGVPLVTPAPITWPTWAIEEDPTISAYRDAC
jgi:hypothetical protein